jgi:hypothetical protein
VLGVAAVAGETAREARTRTMVSRLHTLLMDHYNSYASRRIDTSVFGAATDPRQIADNRLLALRQLMKMEMPDRWSDLLNATVETVPPNAPPGTFDDMKKNTGNRFAHPPTDLWSIYIRRYRRLVNDPESIRAHQGAECLYLIIMNATGDGEARTLFGETSIGDTDGDGAPEFLDGWGNPIGFVRWPAGFVSDAQLSLIRLDEIYDAAEANVGGSGDNAVASAIALDHDPFDVFRRDLKGSSGLNSGPYALLRDSRSAYRLIPLIYSAGRDEDADINVDPDFNTASDTWLDPYAPTLNGKLLGAPIDDDSEDNLADNIHNHLIATR